MKRILQGELWFLLFAVLTNTFTEKHQLKHQTRISARR